MPTSVDLPGGTSRRDFFRLHLYRKKKFGKSRTAWLAFNETKREVIGRTCELSEMTNREALALIEVLRRLPDATPEGQEVMAIE